MSTVPIPGSSLAKAPTARGWAWLTAIYVGVAMVAIAWPILTNVHHVWVVYSMLLALTASLALVLAIRYPLPAIALGGVSWAVTAVLASATAAPWPWPVPTMITHLFTVILLALVHGWRWGAAAWGTGAAISLIAVMVVGPGNNHAANAIACAGVGAGVLAAASGLGLLVRSRHDLAEERSARVEESERRGELQERNRIAQELHDVVAHSMSVISVQATTAPFRITGMPPGTKDEFDSIAHSSRTALTEMRSLLAILRGDDEADLAPQPGLADVVELVESSRSSGTPIELSIVPTDVPDVPPATGLTAYRVVQEAVSNALRHAPGAHVSVRIRAAATLDIEVVNGPAEREPGASAGAGLGLKGIRDRVRALGGDVVIGPTPDDGFAVRASLPSESVGGGGPPRVGGGARLSALGRRPAPARATQRPMPPMSRLIVMATMIVLNTKAGSECVRSADQASLVRQRTFAPARVEVSTDIVR
jgi:signal transduction histidine kinase